MKKTELLIVCLLSSLSMVMQAQMPVDNYRSSTQENQKEKIQLGYVTGINGDDASPTLYNPWVLVSYGNETNEVKKESEGYFYLITFHPDGRYSGQAYGNEMFGEYQCVGNEMTLSWPEMTQVYYEWADPDEFFLAHLHDVSSYRVVNKELRLYYSEDQYFKFRLKDDMSVPDAITTPRIPKTSNGVYDLQGRKINAQSTMHRSAEGRLLPTGRKNAQLKKGVYIENGRKRVVK